MESNEQVDIRGLITKCVCSADEKVQMKYLSQVVMHVMVESVWGKRGRLPDSEILKRLGIPEENLNVAMEILDGFYTLIAGWFFYNSTSSVFPVIRSKAIMYMQNELERRRIIQQEAEQDQ